MVQPEEYYCPGCKIWSTEKCRIHVIIEVPLKTIKVTKIIESTTRSRARDKKLKPLENAYGEPGQLTIGQCTDKLRKCDTCGIPANRANPLNLMQVLRQTYEHNGKYKKIHRIYLCAKCFGGLGVLSGRKKDDGLCDVRFDGIDTFHNALKLTIRREDNVTAWSGLLSYRSYLDLLDSIREELKK